VIDDPGESDQEQQNASAPPQAALNLTAAMSTLGKTGAPGA